ncbi:hypothetical protein RchiOBHm_Chr4g0394131 [Rosa chinensis]|uniref:Uncharacterized protein n=1 Tax=Rosa chinensis TaxID=74649 RepID=A0A2P6QR52_ROSCH|nr:hypothetical protein RchiOBHm_Chr4g0394131 [Rosa chinensis]
MHDLIYHCTKLAASSQEFDREKLLEAGALFHLENTFMHVTPVHHFRNNLHIRACLVAKYECNLISPNQAFQCHRD